jgi:hypothetical protein
MTHDPGDPSPLSGQSISCAAARAHLPAYRAGRLAADTSWQLEWHAAHCPNCGALLDRPLVSPSQVPATPLIDQLAIAAAPSNTERAAMRRQVQSRCDAPDSGSRRATHGWRWGLGLSAAAAMLALVVRRPAIPASDQIDGGVAVAPGLMVPTTAVGSASMANAVQLATARAAIEFAEIDAAAIELNALLAGRPDDAELRAFRAALDARRHDLSRQVASVTQ